MQKDGKEQKTATVTSLNDVRAQKTARKFSIPATEGEKDDANLSTRKVYEQIDYSTCSSAESGGTETGQHRDADGAPVKFTPYHLHSLTSFFNEGKDKGVFYSYDLEEKENHSRFTIHGVKDSAPLRIAFMKVREQEGQSICRFTGDIDQEKVSNEPYAILKGILNTQAEARKRFLV